MQLRHKIIAVKKDRKSELSR